MISKDQIIEIVEEFRNDMGEDLNIPLTFNKFKTSITRIGGTIEIIPENEWDYSKGDGKIQILSNGENSEFTISIPDKGNDKRNMFTIAHELGHYFLHLKNMGNLNFNDNIYSYREAFRNNLPKPDEYEANEFGANLLMPKELFKNKFKEFNGDKRNLSDFFNVSIQAIGNRIMFLGL